MKKIICKNTSDLPSFEDIKNHTKESHLVLQFPKNTIQTDIDSTIDNLQRELSDYSVFYAGNDNITIKKVISKENILKNLKTIQKALIDYIQLSEQLRQNVTDEKNWNNWELTYEHFPHNRYENFKTGQSADFCDYKMTNLADIDPYFFGEFIQTSTHYPELNNIIKERFHDTRRILDTLETMPEIKLLFK